MKQPDLRQQMHPKVAATVPSTPEAKAILNGELIKPMAFGGLVTKLIENGAVESMSMEAVRTEVSETLGIKVEEFDERLRDPEVLDDATVWTWHDNYKEKAEGKLIEAKTETAKTHFNRAVEERVGDGNLGKLQPRIDAAAAKVTELEERLGEANVEEVDLTKIPPRLIFDRLMLEKAHKPELEALEASPYAISLADLAEMLQSDTFLLADGEEFGEEVVKDFSYQLIEEAKVLPESYWLTYLYEGKMDYLGEEEIEAMRNIWLSKAEVDLLAESYARKYYAHNDKDVPGESELEALPNPVRQAMFVSDKERADFFQTFPLANGAQPK
jgi:hypothetical protein